MKGKSKRFKIGKLDLSKLPPPILPKPKDVPGLFVFVWCNELNYWYAICDKPLLEIYRKLTNRDLATIKFSESLAMLNYYELEDLRALQKGLGSTNRSGKSVLMIESDRKLQYWIMTRHCIDLVCAMHEELGQDLNILFNLSSRKINCEQTLAASRDSLKKKFSKALMYAVPGPILPQGRGRPMQTVLVEGDGLKKKIPLPLRAIQISLELATNSLRSPTKLEVTQELEKLHPELKPTQRGHVSQINWSMIFKQAGLSKLPTSRAKKEK